MLITSNTAGKGKGVPSGQEASFYSLFPSFIHSADLPAHSFPFGGSPFSPLGAAGDQDIKGKGKRMRISSYKQTMQCMRILSNTTGLRKGVPNGQEASFYSLLPSPKGGIVNVCDYCQMLYGLTAHLFRP
jgi:hypothetical protein